MVRRTRLNVTLYVAYTAWLVVLMYQDTVHVLVRTVNTTAARSEVPAAVVWCLGMLRRVDWYTQLPTFGRTAFTFTVRQPSLQ